MNQTDLDALEKKYSRNAMCICLLADLRILCEQEKMQVEVLNSLKFQIKSLEAILTT